MKKYFLTLMGLCCTLIMVAQPTKHTHDEDTTDVFYRHLQLNEVLVTGVTGETKLKHSTAPISVVTGK